MRCGRPFRGATETLVRVRWEWRSAVPRLVRYAGYSSVQLSFTFKDGPGAALLQAGYFSLGDKEPFIPRRRNTPRDTDATPITVAGGFDSDQTCRLRR